MTLTITEALDAVRSARETIANADRTVQSCVSLVIGRLRTADVYKGDLVALKRELQDFDSTRRRWKAK